MKKTILGLDVNDYNTSAALLVDGKIVSAAQEERFNREKLTRRFPLHTMRFCLRENEVEISELDAIAVSVNPGIYLEALSPPHSERARYRGEILYGVPNYLLGLDPSANSLATHLCIDLEERPKMKIHYVTHHDAHAGVAYYASPFDKAGILSVDGFGEKETAVYFKAEGDQITRLKSVEFPQSIGLFYAAITEYLGFRPFDEEWKIMGASAYGDPSRFARQFQDLLRYTGEGNFEVALPYFNYYQFHRPRTFHERLTELLGPPYLEGGHTDERFFDIAAGVQRITEKVVCKMLHYLYEMVPSENLCFTGGVAQNCVLNGKIALSTPFKNIFVPPMPDDSGTSLGAPLWAYHQFYGGHRNYTMEHNYLGPCFSDHFIERQLKIFKIPYSVNPNPAESAAQLLTEGKILGWFQGGMEFGDRALGNRSILADPRDSGTKNRLNDQVKFREAFRPFAPSILDEYAAEYFHSVLPSPYMEKVFKVKEEKQSLIPAVVHVDGSARLQTVTRTQNPLFFRLIEEFHRLSGIPLILNTSFNVRGEPIVCTPRDAIRTFYSCGLDALFLNHLMIEKQPSSMPYATE